MSLTGNAESGYKLRGKLRGLKTIHGHSAYEVAVINGFSGTEEEWLASMKGDPGYTPQKGIDYFDGEDGYTPQKGVDYYTAAEKQALVDEVLETVMENTVGAKVGEVTLLAAKWAGSGSLYSQVVTIDGVTEHSQVDLTPDVAQLVVFYEKDLTFVTENEGGIVTVYAIGQKPTNDYTIQVTITEVSV